MAAILGPIEGIPLDTPSPVKVEGHSYLVLRRSASPDSVCVVDDKCPHAGLSLSRGPRGKYQDGVITCPWHNSEFDMCSGENLDWAPGFAGVKAPGWSRKLVAMGRTPAPLHTHSVSIVNGIIIIDA